MRRMRRLSRSIDLIDVRLEVAGGSTLSEVCRVLCPAGLSGYILVERRLYGGDLRLPQCFDTHDGVPHH
jgi:hypothetical protein